jgi:hypothetical protein
MTYIHKTSLCTLVATIIIVVAGTANSKGYASPVDLKAAGFAPVALFQGGLDSVDEKVIIEAELPRFNIKSQFYHWHAHDRTVAPIVSVRGAGNFIDGATDDYKLFIQVLFGYIPCIKPVEDFARRDDFKASEICMLVACKVSS